MKNAVTWFKGNWPIVVLGVVTVAALPTLWYFSSQWNNKLVQQLQEQVSKDYTSVSSAKVQYNVLSLTGEPLLARNVEVNRDLTSAYQAIGTQLTAESGKVGQTAVAFNQHKGTDREFKVLIDGIFPQPAEFEERLKPNQFVAAYSRAHGDLLKVVKAGMPPAPAELAQQLADLDLQKREQYRQEHGAGELDTAARAALAEELLAFRISAYQRRASEIQVYADASVFDDVPAGPLEKPPTLAKTWDWQEKFWIHSDVAYAIAEANGDSNGRGVPGSVVKRIFKVSVKPSRMVYSGDGNPSAATFEAGMDKPPQDFGFSITGRVSGPGSNNKWYDVRTVTLDLMVDSRRLPEFIDALAKTNFMTVTRLELARVEIMDDIAAGFYYGENEIVRATMDVETIWFREWKKSGYQPNPENPGDAWRQWLMPLDVQKSLGMVEGTVGEDTSAPAAAPPPMPRGGPPADEDLGGRRGRRGRDDG